MSERTFPVQGSNLGVSGTLPWTFVETFRAQLEKNHGQTMERLAERGGCSLGELIPALLGLPLALQPSSRAQVLAFIERYGNWCAQQVKQEAAAETVQGHPAMFDDWLRELAFKNYFGLPPIEELRAAFRRWVRESP